jgi:4-diphosphocytidyl-2-C-methyl-D-erythritol kinase
MTVFSPAKLNLALRVLAREASGFHQIESLFCLLELADRIDIDTAAEGLSLEVVSPPESAGPPPDLGPPESNLAWRAAELFFQATRMRPGAAIRLTKRIPHGGGLGGGSSNAAAVLTSLNQAHGSPVPQAELLALAGRLGSDVPFFAAGVPRALAWGRGTRLLPLSSLPSRPVLLAVNGTPVSTAEAYALLAGERGVDYVAPPALLEPAADWHALADSAVNDFEGVVFRMQPRLRDLLSDIHATAPLLARMTGTGNVLFGVYRDAGALESARTSLAASWPDVRWLVTRTR